MIRAHAVRSKMIFTFFLVGRTGTRDASASRAHDPSGLDMGKDATQILEISCHLIVISRQMRSIDMTQIGARRIAALSHPNVVDQIEVLDVLWHGV
jgi:hypothetical protein